MFFMRNDSITEPRVHKRCKMPDQIGNISQTDSKYIGTFIGVLPILRPFKIHYRDPRKEEEGDELEVGVFMILPHENNIDESEVLDLTISMEDSRISTAEEMPSLMKKYFDSDLMGLIQIL